MKDICVSMIFPLLIGFIIWYIYSLIQKQYLNLKNLLIVKPPTIQTQHKFIEHLHSDELNLIKSKNKISILTYNILCQKFMKRKNRPDLNLQNRMKMIIEEVNSLNPDIILLQEFNIQNYKTYITNENHFPDYNFEYGDNYGSHLINVTGYNKERFKLTSKFNLNLFDVRVDGNRGVLHTVLEDSKTSQKISVYNVHFPWNPIYEFEKCEILNLISENILNRKIKRVIVAGDFNSLPDSIVMRLMYAKYLKIEMKMNLGDAIEDESHKIFNEIINKENISENEYLNNKPCIDSKILERKTFLKFFNSLVKDEKKKEKFKSFFRNSEIISDTFNFRSAYDTYKFLINKNVLDTVENKKNLHDYNLRNPSNESFGFLINHPDYTNFTHNFKNTIDYIFYSSSFVLKKILQLPELNELTQEEFLPSSKFPSDHIKLYSEFFY